MKLTTLTFLSVLIPCSFGIAQITITENDFPSGGDAITVSQAIDLQIDYQSAGPNHQWDFSHLSFLNQVTREYSSLSGVPFLINFAYGPFAISAYRASYYTPFTDLPLNQFGNLLPIQIADVYQYTKKTDQRLNLIGYSASISGQSVPIKSDTIETKYYLPLNYGDEYVSRGYTNLDLSMFIPAQWVQKRKRTTVVDGWGELTTPYGTFDVLRVQHRIEETDSVEYDGTNFGIDIPVMYEYEWLTNGEKVPVLKVTTTEVLGVEAVISVEYRDNNYLSTENIQSSDNLLVYPNPANDELTISWKEGSKSVRVYHVSGTLADEFLFQSVSKTINTSEYESGMYFLSIENEGQVVIKSFIKQ